MLEGKNLACVRGDRTLFSHVDFTLREGELLLVQGANGSGKTSLLRIVCGLLAPAHGEVLWHNESISDKREGYHAEMIYLGHSPAIKDDLSAFENVHVSCRLAGIQASREEVKGALVHMGLAHCLDLPAKFLSQGQRRRVSLSRLLLAKAGVWILDEPLTALDQAALKLLHSLVGDHLRRGGMTLMSTHQSVWVSGVEPKAIRLTS